MHVDDVAIRILGEDSLSFVDVLVQDAGWNQLRSDWQRVLRYEPNGCFGAFSGERLIGTVTTTTYGDQLAWIGLMLVHPDSRRRGIATALMRCSIAYLRERGVTCITLDATPEGQCVYEPLGFVADDRFHRWERTGDGALQTVCPNATLSLDDSLRQIDRAAFGADRSGYLNLLDEDSFSVATADGFGMIRSGRRATYLGPVIAATPNTAEQLIRALIDQIPGRIFWDVPPLNSEATAIAERFGFQRVRDLTRMSCGRLMTSPDYRMQFAIASPETG